MHHARYLSENIHVRQSEREQQRDHRSDALEFFHVNSHKPFSGRVPKINDILPPVQSFSKRLVPVISKSNPLIPDELPC